MITIFIPLEIIGKIRRGIILSPKERSILNDWSAECEINRNYLAHITTPGRLEELKNLLLRTDFDSMSREIETRLDAMK